MKVLTIFAILSSFLIFIGCSTTDEDDSNYQQTQDKNNNQVSKTTVVIDETVKVAPGSYRAYTLSGIFSTYNFEINSDSDVNVWFLTEENYQLFINDDEFEYISSATRERVLSFSASYRIMDNKKYYLVLDNQFSIFTSKNVKIKMTRTGM